MDISAASLSAISQAQTKSQVDIAVAKKAQDSQKQTGEAVVGMLQALADSAKARGGIDVQG
jgi:hypothetical protein